MEKEKISNTFTIFTWNIGNPSLKRATSQFSWLEKQIADVFILTECKKSEGCFFIERAFRGYRLFQEHKYHIVFPTPPDNEYGVLIASNHKLKPSFFSNRINYLRSRVNSVNVFYSNEEIEIIGLYVPSRGFDIHEIREKKKRFTNVFLSALEASPGSFKRIICGDFNVLEPDHVPHYSYFEDWEYDYYCAMKKYGMQDAFRYLHPTAQEYSWFGKSGNAYRYDHCFVSLDLVPLINKCYYFHEPRELGLSDHSALITVFRLPDNLKRR